MASDTLYLFGDQSIDLLPAVRKLRKQCRHYPVLKGFMRTATDQIQQALLKTPTHLRCRVQPFDNPLQLAEVIDDSSEYTPITSSLLAVVQLGNFIIHLSSNPCALDGSQSCPTFLSLCTGSLAAAAVASSRNLTELLRVAPQIVTLAFFLGLEAFKRSRNLEVSRGSWATVVKDVDLDQLRDTIEEFNQTLDDRHHKRVYISAIAESSVTIGGPPSVTQRFLKQSALLRGAKKLQLPIRAAFHSRHLFPVPHSRVFEHVDRQHLRRQLRHLTISPSSGKPYASTNLECVLHEIMDEILQRPIDWQTATRELPNLLTSSARMFPIGPSYATQALSQWFQVQTSEDDGEKAGPGLQSAREGSSAIAVVGMSLRLPGSETLEEFWEVLRQGKELHQKIPVDRFDLDTHFDPTGKTKNATQTPYGVFIDRPGYFDPRFFNMSPREALQTDPQQRLMLLTTYEALENAGYSPNRTPSTDTRRIASFVGQTGDDYREMNSGQDVDTYFITGGIRAFGPGRLNYHFGWEGQSYSIDTACSSSGASIQLACSALLARECDTAVSGGANLLTSPKLFAGLSKGGFLSKTGQCKTFDQSADGYVRGEGCGVLVLKRLEDAVADRDNVLAVIRGAATNHSAEAVSITHPHGKTQERLFKTVLSEAGVLPHEVDVAEIHGTGTQAGDATESRSVTNVLCQGRTPDNPLVLSAVKPNIGHSEAASGISSAIKAILMMQKNAIPPHVGIKSSMSNKLPSFQDAHATLCFEETPFLPRADGDGKRRVLINNFDAAGGNTSFLLEDPPQLAIEGQDLRSHKVIVLSGKSASALANNTRNLLQWLKVHPDIRIEDVAYTTTSRRMHYQFRTSYSAASVSELVKDLERQVSSSEVIHRAAARRSTVFCFTGQGSQYVSMAAGLYETHAVFRELIDDFERICIFHGFPSFRPIMEGDSSALECPIMTQLAIVAVELALALLWKSWGVKATSVIGHSLGEYPALCFANVISPSDCFYLVGKRAELIKQKCVADSHAMLAVQATAGTTMELLQETGVQNTEIACFNGPTSTVVCGSYSEISSVSIAAKSRGIKTRSLATRYAFHSSQLDPVLDQYEAFAKAVHFAKPEIPVASTMLGKVVTESNIFGSSYLKLQSRNPVKYQTAVEALHSSSTADEQSVWIEVGPSPTCLGLIRSIFPGSQVTLHSLQPGRSDWQVLSSSVAAVYSAGLYIDWPEFHRPFEHRLQMVQLPNYSFDLKNYWIYPDQAASRQQAPLEPNGACSARQPLFTPTDTLQCVEKQEITADMIRVTFTSNASEPNFHKVLCGHLVNGTALCPSSVYADMAFAAADHVQKLSEVGTISGIDINDLEVIKPLIISSGNTAQFVQVTATKKRCSDDVRLDYSSVSGGIHVSHAKCVARFRRNEARTIENLMDRDLIQSRINDLHQASSHGRVHRLLRPMVYKLFKAFVDYSDEYQGLEEVHLDSNKLEAAATVKFRSNSDRFACNPHWIDSIAHLSGFVLNGTEFTPEDSVFISHGWRSLSFFKTLSAEKRYQSYVQMQPGSHRGLFIGDVYVFEGDRIVALCQELRFQQIRRKVLDHLLPGPVSVTAKTARNDVRPPLRVPASEVSAADVVANDSAYKSLPNVTRPPPSFNAVLNVVAGELGIETSDLDDDIALADLGIDSLMIPSIVMALDSKLDIQIPSSVFVDCSSLREIRAHLNTGSNLPPTLTNVLEPLESTRTVMGDCNVQSSLANVLQIIAEEVGIDTSELEDGVFFTDLGVDSLLTISILTTLNQRLGLHLPASIFVQYPSVSALCLYLQASTKCRNLAIIDEAADEAADDSDVSDTQSSSDEEYAGHITPLTELSDYEGEVCAPGSPMAHTVREIVAEETGLDMQEIGDDIALSELGVDSLLTMSILMRFKDLTGSTLSSTFLVDNPTISSITQALSSDPERSADVKLRSEFTPFRASNDSVAQATKRQWGASSILLQGSSLCTSPCLFLIPDGSGSSASYVGLPALNHTGPVYGLNSPFLAEPQSFKMPLQDLVELYVTEMRRIQPTGPYHIGGWSIGGICAFEAASQLISKCEEEVSSLVLIDAPCPTILPPVPLEDIDFVQAVGALDSVRPSAKHAGGVALNSAALGRRNGIREHFAGSINALGQYSARPIDTSKSPKRVTLLWAQDGVWNTLGEEMKLRGRGPSTSQHPTTRWLMDTRASYETCGWEGLLPGSDFTCHAVRGDHFSIMGKPGVMEMGAKISQSLSRQA